MRLPNHRLVFVGGLHRSGTTLLARCLAGHPQVSGFQATGAPEDEGQHLQSVYPSAKVYGGPGRFAFDPRAHLTEDQPSCRESVAQELFDQWRPYWDLSKALLVEKSPPNLIMMRYLQGLYPDAYFVLVVRHPVVVSLATRKWRWDLGIQALLAHWFHAHELAAADARSIRRLHVVRYEALVDDPRTTLRRLGTWLGLEGPVSVESVRTDRSRKYARLWYARRWMSLPWWRPQGTGLERQFSSRCVQFGYRLDDLSAVNMECDLLPGS